MAGDSPPNGAVPDWLKSSAVGWKSPIAIESVRANKGESAGSFAAPAIRLKARTPPTMIKKQTTFCRSPERTLMQLPPFPSITGSQAFW
jgi:hypothetical protein